MPIIKDHLSQFQSDLQNNISVICNRKNGTWERANGRFIGLLELSQKDKEKRLVKIGKTFGDLLDQLEQKPVRLSSSGNSDSQAEYRDWLLAGKTVKRMLNECSSSQGKMLRQALAWRLTALYYRIEASEKGVEGSLDAEGQKAESKLLSFAAHLKKKNTLFTDKQLNARDEEKIGQACKYPQFVKLLLNSPEIRDFFLKSVIRDRAEVDLFIQYPHLFEKLKNAYLISRIGRCGHRVLQIDKRDNGVGEMEKVVTLPFWTKDGVRRINILDDKAKVTLQEGWRLTIREVFAIFANKNEDHGDLEFFGKNGVINWNSRELGAVVPKKQKEGSLHFLNWEMAGPYLEALTWPDSVPFWRWFGYKEEKEYRRIDLDRAEWWKSLPVFESYTKEEVEQKNPLIVEEDGVVRVVPLELKEGEWLVCAKSSRNTADLDLDDRHGYMEVYIPQPDGTYFCYPFGKYAESFAVTVFQKILFLVGTLRAKVAYPDENVFYSQRQHASYPMKLSREQGLSLMGMIKNDILKARGKNLIFQFGAENCAHWVQTVLALIKGIQLPNLFVSPILNSEPAHPLMKNMFSLIKQMPEKFHSTMLHILDTIFLSMRGVFIEEEGRLIWKSHATSNLRKANLIYQPGYLHKQIEEKTLKGHIFTGH